MSCVCNENNPHINPKHIWRKEKHHVICTQRKRAGPRRVCNHSCPCRHRCHCCYALAWSKDRQHLQHHQQLSTITCTYPFLESKKRTLLNGRVLFIPLP